MSAAASSRIGNIQVLPLTEDDAYIIAGLHRKRGPLASRSAIVLASDWPIDSALRR
jgi:hypothetical protein